MSNADQTTVQTFTDSDEEKQTQPRADNTDEKQESVILFRWTDDPFVNEAAAELGRQLLNEFGDEIKVRPTYIKAKPSDDISRIATWIKQRCKQALSNTHRRSTVAHQLNAIVEKVGKGSDDNRWVPPSDRPFPEGSNEDLTIYPNDEVNTEVLEDNGLPTDEMEYVDDDMSSLYTLSPTFVGNPSGYQFEKQLGRFERYLETYQQAVTGPFKQDDAPCMLCGTSDMPTTKDVEGENLEFNQSFNILSTASAVSVPLGMGGRRPSHKGRCVACLLAGFYYTLMSKVVRFKNRESCGGSFPIAVQRVFTPRGDFEKLVDIRGDFDTDLLTWIDTPTTNSHTRRGTLEATRTGSRALQTLQFYESVLRYVNREYTQDHYEFAIEHRPTALISYTSARQKSGRPVRSIREVESIDPDTWAYGAVREQIIGNSDGKDDISGENYWPFDDVFKWYARLDEIAIETLDNLGYGVLERNLKRLARGHFEVAKSLERKQGANVPYVLPIQRTSHYFTTIMQQATHDTADSIDGEAIESIKRVASNVGEVFYERDDISVLIALQNSNTSAEFLDAFEKASMQTQKKASVEEGSHSWSGQNDVAQVLKLINDSETFETAKRMFVIHASLSAQYTNAQRASGGEPDE